MLLDATYAEAKTFIFVLALTQARIIALCVMIPLFSRNSLPGMLRLGMTLALGLVATPMLITTVPAKIGFVTAVLLVAKEIFVGLCLGFMVAIPFWVFGAMGSVIDNQRGASIGAVLNPDLDSESTPLGILFGHAYGVFFLVGGGFLLMLSMLYDSFRIWNPWQWAPVLHRETLPLLLSQLDNLTRLVVLYSAPAVVAMLLAELGLALASRFTPQLQVFFLAMPIKSGLAILVLVLYMTTLFDYAGVQAGKVTEILPFLQRHWLAP